MKRVTAVGLIKPLQPIYRPNTFTVQKFDKPGSEKVVSEEKFEFASRLVGGGWHYQADEVARCVRDGKIESDIWGWDKTRLQMQVFDEVGVIDSASGFHVDHSFRCANKAAIFFPQVWRNSKMSRMRIKKQSLSVHMNHERFTSRNLVSVRLCRTRSVRR